MPVASIVMFALVAIVPIWAVISPRTQWRILVGWSERNPGAHEPGAIAIAVHRAVAAVAIAATIFTFISLSPPANPPAESPERTAADPIRERWGTPDPRVVNRVFSTVTIEPTASIGSNPLVRIPLQGFEAMDGAHRNPNYLFGLPSYSRPDAADGDGFLGVKPSIGMTALDSANIVVQVRADSRCTPQQVLVVESLISITVAVYYGLPITGASQSALAPCDANAPASTATSELIPIDLSRPVGDRSVVDLDGTPIAPVKSR